MVSVDKGGTLIGITFETSDLFKSSNGVSFDGSARDLWVDWKRLKVLMPLYRDFDPSYLWRNGIDGAEYAYPDRPGVGAEAAGRSGWSLKKKAFFIPAHLAGK